MHTYVNELLSSAIHVPNPRRPKASHILGRHTTFPTNEIIIFSHCAEVELPLIRGK